MIIFQSCEFVIALQTFDINIIYLIYNFLNIFLTDECFRVFT